MSAIVLLLVAHWYLSLLCQSLFLHRYASHRQFEFAPGWERAVHLLTYLAQGPSYLCPRAYAVLHRRHHCWSDTPLDPHSPRNHGGVVAMMWATKRRYDELARAQAEVVGSVPAEERERGLPDAADPAREDAVPDWPLLERLRRSWLAFCAWIVAWTGVYAALAPSAAWLLLVPLHLAMGPVHGAIVNWCGHRWGPSPFDTGDDSRNTLARDFVALGELLQNNHHRPGRADFAAREGEIDPTFAVIRLLARLGIIRPA